MANKQIRVELHYAFCINANIIRMSFCVRAKCRSNCLQAVTFVRLNVSVTIKSGFVCVSGDVL